MAGTGKDSQITRINSQNSHGAGNFCHDNYLLPDDGPLLFSSSVEPTEMRSTSAAKLSPFFDALVTCNASSRTFECRSFTYSLIVLHSSFDNSSIPPDLSAERQLIDCLLIGILAGTWHSRRADQSRAERHQSVGEKINEWKYRFIIIVRNNHLDDDDTYARIVVFSASDVAIILYGQFVVVWTILLHNVVSFGLHGIQIISIFNQLRRRGTKANPNWPNTQVINWSTWEIQERRRWSSQEALENLSDWLRFARETIAAPFLH